MNILIINGPNLNLLGEREVNVYGNLSFEKFLTELRETFPALNISYYQSNIEGEIIDMIHEGRKTYDALIINAGGYSHTSVAIRDALACVEIPVIEVHISNIYKREDFRHTLLLAPKAIGCITGFGLFSYNLAIEALLNHFASRKIGD
ncbi:MAG: 3-dehydroquinate dehydratase [Bacteroidetes bacterium ADurb.Bin408]|nr:MAG: 3-dehydroquinate dehydratase [Bacteroidetes bacterium ADurb.Bin408]